jgi:hypothetical protein
MITIIKAELDRIFKKITDQAPTTKAKFHSISIMDVNPLELITFMKENNIPDDAEFEGVDNGYDAYNDFALGWRTPIPTTEKDRDYWVKERFNRNAVTALHQGLVKDGYYKKGFDSILYRKFVKTSLLDRFLNDDLESIVEYYSTHYFMIEK